MISREKEGKCVLISSAESQKDANNTFELLLLIGWQTSRLFHCVSFIPILYAFAGPSTKVSLS